VIALVFSYEVRDPAQFEAAYGPEGEWARFFAGARGYVGTELLRDVETPGRYLVVDRWDFADAYNAFAGEHREE
jgi:heme-degrading monooxygenase HmoA